MVTKKRSISNGGITFDKARNAYRTYITTPDGTRLEIKALYNIKFHFMRENRGV